MTILNIEAMAKANNRKYVNAKLQLEAISEKIKVAVNGGEGNIGQLMMERARISGTFQVYSRVMQILNGATASQETIESEVILLALIDMAVGGADDQWSGRGNDEKRSTFDGVLEAIRVTKDRIEFCL